MVSLTRAGSKLVLRTSPAPGHYLCIKWDFASLLQAPSRPPVSRAKQHVAPQVEHEN